MTTSISIKTGPLTAERIFVDDAAAQQILLAYAKQSGALDSMTNQQKLQYIVDSLVTKMVTEARAERRMEINAAAANEINAINFA